MKAIITEVKKEYVTARVKDTDQEYIFIRGSINSPPADVVVGEEVNYVWSESLPFISKKKD